MRDQVPQEVLGEIARQYRVASEAAVTHFADEKADEDALTASLGTELRNQVKGGLDIGGLRYAWSTRQIRVRGRGKNAPEKVIGADAVLAIEVRAGDDILASKLIPIQAKKAWKTTDRLLPGQARKMIDVFGSALIVDYSPTGYVAADGAAVLAAHGDRRRMPAGTMVSLGEMLAERFLQCTIGTQDALYDERTHRVYRIDEADDPGTPAEPRQVLRTTISIPEGQPVSSRDKRPKKAKSTKRAKTTARPSSTKAPVPSPSTTASSRMKTPVGMRAAESAASRPYGAVLGDEAEWQTRRRRIDPRLDVIGWCRVVPRPDIGPSRSEEEDTDAGPADYAFWLGKRVVAVVEAKKVTTGPQNVLTQAERYSKGLRNGSFNFNGYRAPFLYSTNGEVFWFHDVRYELNRSRRVAGFHTPSALQEYLSRDFEADCASLRSLPHNHPRLRDYQKDANRAVDQAIADRKRNLLVAMATGTGKTFTLVNQIYRLMKTKVARRVLFLVDRRALAAQAVRAFSAFEVEPGKKFDQVYEVYSSKFQQEDFDEEEKFDPKLLPNNYLTDPQPGHSFVYVCTIQRMAINLLGRGAIFGMGDETADDDAEKLDIPIHAFDAIVADECHRGYTSQEISTWRSTLEHFDAIKIGLTATPASHTTAYFTHKVFDYPYERAVREGISSTMT